MHFGATLRLLRASAGMSLSGLAAHVGVSPAYISRVEHGHDAPPTPDRLRAIAAALGLSPDAMTDLVEDLRPDAAEWLGHTAAGRHLAAELRRRELGPAQLARVAEFVRREFPLSTQSESPTSLFTEQRVLHGVTVPTLGDALDIAAGRLVTRADLSRVSGELRAQAHTTSGPPACAIGGGLCVAHALAPGSLRGILLLLDCPLDQATPDDIAIRAVVVLVGSDDKVLARGLIRVARLASGHLVERLCNAPSASAAMSLLP